MTAAEVATLSLTFVGALFFLGGTAGMLRFPDVFSRLHALTKADNVGLGFIVAGLAVHAGDAGAALKLLAVWTLSLAASATASYLVANLAGRGAGEARR